MKLSGRSIGIFAVVALLGLLLWSTLASQRAECRICVAYRGAQNCATASGSSMKAAAHAAQATACGTIAQGMNASIGCGRVEPISRRCTTS